MRGVSRWDLVAMTIMLVAVLLLALLPMRSREPATGPSCWGNLRQIATAAMMYSSDHGERFPPIQTAGGDTLPFLLDPYSRNNRIWTCPTNPGWKQAFDGSTADRGVDYGYNWLALGPDSTGTRSESVAHPEATIAFIDSTSYRATPRGLLQKYPGTPPDYRHGRGANVAWADGHVSFTDDQIEKTARAESGRQLGIGIQSFPDWNLR